MEGNQIGIDLNIVNNQITNIESVLAILNSKTLNEDLIEHISSLKNRIQNMDISNKQELESAINAKIMEYNTMKNVDSNNLDILRMLQQTNDEFKKLSIIETPREKNDSDKYVDYFSYTNGSGEVKVLSFASSNILNDYIRDHGDTISTYKASELFDKLKNLGCEELSFRSKEEYEGQERNKAIINDPEIENQEYREVEDYIKKFGSDYEIKITVSEVGERLYQVGDGLIKFRNDAGKRVMDVLKQPTIKKGNVYDELLKELDDEPSINKSETVSIETSTTVDSYSSLESIGESDFDKNKLSELITRRDVYDMALTFEEEHLINVYTKYLLETFADESNSNENREILTDLMEKKRGRTASIIERYPNPEKEAKENSLNDLEKVFAEMYLKKKELVKDKLASNNKRLELKQDANKGLATVVILLEIIILAMFIMMFLHLDI